MPGKNPRLAGQYSVAECTLTSCPTSSKTFYLDLEYALQALSPAHRRAVIDWRLLCVRGLTSTAPSGYHLLA